MKRKWNIFRIFIICFSIFVLVREFFFETGATPEQRHFFIIFYSFSLIFFIFKDSFEEAIKEYYDDRAKPPDLK